jgi:hypothetical protein
VKIICEIWLYKSTVQTELYLSGIVIGIVECGGDIVELYREIGGKVGGYCGVCDKIRKLPKFCLKK